MCSKGGYKELKSAWRWEFRLRSCRW